MHSHQSSFNLPVLQMSGRVYESIKETIGSKPAETGGILGGSLQTWQVTHFFFDEGNRKQSGIAYSPNNPLLNHIIKTHWQPQGIEYLGSIHSHPAHVPSPSAGDGVYARRILDIKELPCLLTPIVTTIPDTGAFSLLPFVAIAKGEGVSFFEQELIVDYQSVRGGTRREPLLVPEFFAWQAAQVFALATGTTLAFAAGLLVGRGLSRQRRNSYDRHQ